ncbi:MAG: hypothetical protein MPEBLZ_03255 [Candidatus Methanoperedens nitroreducens]|uniref:Uncharacterized protein n=1 Tax=Candidatus Methanoperedens nitratireducens TaxID=1392998 RepID=A0A0P8A6J7_9EURY|nr:MAG: hypothetical protein MPEBLZ_03255 [Candidatus Methanoperedens sp. BLZ1]
MSIHENKNTVKIEFRTVTKESVKDLVKSEIIELASRKDFDKKLRDLRKDNFVLEYEVVK